MRRIREIPGILHSVYFHIEEFACRDGTPYPEQWIESRLVPLVVSLEFIRERVGVPLIILSGYRTPAYNKRIGGARNSMHCEGLAADIRVAGCGSRWLYDHVYGLIQSGMIPDGGLALYPSFVHYDQRGSRARWGGKRTQN